MLYPDDVQLSVSASAAGYGSVSPGYSLLTSRNLEQLLGTEVDSAWSRATHAVRHTAGVGVRHILRVVMSAIHMKAAEVFWAQLYRCVVLYMRLYTIINTDACFLSSSQAGAEEDGSKINTPAYVVSAILGPPSCPLSVYFAVVTILYCVYIVLYAYCGARACRAHAAATRAFLASL